MFGLPRLFRKKDLIKKSPQSSQEVIDLASALSSIQAVAQYCNDHKALSDSHFKISSIALKVKHFPKEFKLTSEPKRLFVLEGRLRMVEGSKLVRITAYLFSDLVFWTRDSQLGSEQIYVDHMEFTKQKFKLDDLSAAHVQGVTLRAPKAGLRRRPTNATADLSTGFALTVGNNSVVFFAANTETKETWLQKLEDTAGKGKKK
eukprot:c20493_g1_i2.p1 GENE.c20493_g1_i2~~c20493_g1_i2.p1  ORF type:complete len:203 (+),score=51.72 c20493_g1_i2:2-610(+)